MTNGQWTRIANLPYGASINTLGCIGDSDTAYVSVGYPSSGRSPFFKYTISTDTFTPIPICPYHQNVTGVAYTNGTLVAFAEPAGDTTHITAYIYDPGTQTWSTGASTAALPGGLVWAGGLSGVCYISTIDTSAKNQNILAYTVATNTWATIAALPVQLYRFGPAIDPAGYIYAIGGIHTINSVATVYKYSIATKTWGQSTPLPNVEYGIAATVAADGTIYAFSNTQAGWQNVAVALPAGQSAWVTLPAMPYPTSSRGAAVAVPDTVLTFGGNTAAPSYGYYDYSYGTGPVALSGAAGATVTVAAAGAATGPTNDTGAAIATVTIAPTGAAAAVETAAGAAIAAVGIIATGQGSGAGHAAASATAAVTVGATGAGRAAITLAGAAMALVALTSTGAGVIAAGISGAVQDFPDWVPPHVVIATDNVIYASAPGGDVLPFRPTFVGLGGWASVILTLAALPVEVLAALSVIMEWTSAGSVIATRVIDLVAGTDAADTVAGVQVATVARSDELRVTIPAAAGVGRVLLTLAATTRAIGEAVTPATFPGSAQYAAGPAAGSVPAAGHLDLYAGPYQSGSRLVLAPAAALTVTASRLDVAAGGYTPYDAASWSVTDTAAGPLYLPAPAGVTRWRLTNAAGAPVSVDYYVEGVST